MISNAGSIAKSVQTNPTSGQVDNFVDAVYDDGRIEKAEYKASKGISREGLNIRETKLLDELEKSVEWSLDFREGQWKTPTGREKFGNFFKAIFGGTPVPAEYVSGSRNGAEGLKDSVIADLKRQADVLGLAARFSTAHPDGENKIAREDSSLGWIPKPWVLEAFDEIVTSQDNGTDLRERMKDKILDEISPYSATERESRVAKFSPDFDKVIEEYFPGSKPRDDKARWGRDRALNAVFDKAVLGADGNKRTDADTAKTLKVAVQRERLRLVDSHFKNDLAPGIDKALAGKKETMEPLAYEEFRSNIHQQALSFIRTHHQVPHDISCTAFLDLPFIENLLK